MKHANDAVLNTDLILNANMPASQLNKPVNSEQTRKQRADATAPDIPGR